MKSLLFREPFHAAGEQQFSVTESALQTSDKLAAKYAAQYLHRQEESVTWVNPALVIGREATRWNHAMDMRMNLEILPPGMQDAEESDLGAEVLGIGGDLQQNGGPGVEQEVVYGLFVLRRKPRQC